MNIEQQKERIKTEIGYRLEGFPNFAGIDFLKVYHGGWRIAGDHAYITSRYGYYFPDFKPFIEKDFSNADEVVDKFVETWKKYDTPDNIKRAENMYIEFAKYGTE